MNIEHVYPKVREIIADVLVLDQEEISLNSRLIGQLGAESIDFLDLVFQLEKTFSIKIPRGQLEKNARGHLSEDAFEKGGVLTTEGMQAIQQYFDEIPADQFKPGMKVNEIPMLFTVHTFCKVVVNALKEKAESEVVA